ncbi:hypothetical protein TcBrA4_0122630 [Trypanosoma cruzi]|nr:hypothetical protein TcBrA4_0122630 [Trypanosoma cruzi]
MFDKFVAGLVTTYLGNYFENVNREQVKVSLWSGHVSLRNLRFRRDALRAFDTAVCVKEGYIDELTVIVPWTRLHSECVVVEVKKVRVLLRQKTAAGYDPAREKQEAYERKLHQLNLFEALLQQELAGDTKVETTPVAHNGVPTEGVLEEEEEAFLEAQKDVTFAARLKAVILNNVQLMLKDVVVQYEGCYASGGGVDAGTDRLVGQDYHSFSIVLDNFRTYACDENFAPHFTAAKERVLYKKVVLEGVRILLNATTFSMQQSGCGDDNYAAETIQDTEEASLGVIRGLSMKTTPTTLRQSLPARCHRIISPFSAMAFVQYQPVPYRADLPTSRIELHVDRLRAVLSREEWAILLALWREARDGEEYDVLRHFRPVGAEKKRPTDNARAWWTYAIQVTLHRIRQVRERRVFVWEKYKRLKAAREEYMTLFKRDRRRQLKAIWLTELTMEEKTRLQDLEMELPMESIKIARRLAYHRTHLEREQRETLLERRRQQKHQQKEEAEGKSGEMGEESNGQPAMDVAHTDGKRRSSWWSWLFFSKTRNTQEENAGEPVGGETPDIQAEIEEMFQLVNAERWTAAQRLAIAKEFGIPESEVESLSDAGGSASNGNFEGVRWQVSLRAHALELMLRESDGECASFATLAMEGLTANLVYMFNRCFSFSLDVNDYMVLSHLKEQSRVVSIIRVAKERYVICGCEHEAATSILLKRHHPGSLAEYDAVSGVPPYEICLKWSPIECNVDMPFLRACVEFARPLSSFPFVSLSASSPTPSSRGVPSPCERRQETMDPNKRRTLLMMMVEREFLCSWQLLLHDVRIVASEDERQVSRIKLWRVEVKNDPAKKIEKRRRIQCPTGVPDTFGDDPEDWVNTVHATIGGVTAECLLNTTRVDASFYDVDEDDSKNLWDRITSLPSFTIIFKKSVMMRRSPSVPLFSASIVFEKPLQIRCSRQSLSVLCTSFLMMTDIFQRLSQPAAIDTMHDMSPNSPSKVFLAQVLTVDERYLVEHETSPRLQEEKFYREKMQAPSLVDNYRRVEVMMGKIVVYHVKRPTFPSHFFELYRGHLHVAQDASEVSLFVECGGVSHTRRSGVLKAKEVLFGKYKFPSLWSMPLLEAFIEDWCQEHERSGKGNEEREEVKHAFRTVQTASRTRPCHHIRMRFQSIEEAKRFAHALGSHAVGHHVLDIPPDPTSVEEENQQGGEQQLCLLKMEMSIPKCSFYLRDEAIEKHKEGATPPMHKLFMTSVNISYVQQQKKKLISLATNRLSVMAHARNAPVFEVTRSVAKPPASASTAADDDVGPALTLLFQMKDRLYPHAARKYIKMASSADVKLAFSSELLCVAEMLWDLSGIVTNQIFGHVRYRSIPWSDESAATIEEKWQTDPAGGLLQNDDVSIDLEHLVLSLYYPSDKFELEDETDAAVDDGVNAKPVAVINGSQVNIHWSSAEGCNKSCVTLHRPYILMRRVSTGELGHVVAPTGNQCKEDTKGGIFTGKPTLSLSFSIHREPPMLSISDFIANGGSAGYRYTHFLFVSGENLNIVYWQPQLWSLIEVFSRGVISRAAKLVWRQPYIAGSSLLRWPQPDAPLAPFSWCLLNKRFELSQVHFLLPEKSAHLPAKLWGKADFCRFCDELCVDGESNSTSPKRFVQHISTLTLEGIEVRGIRRKRTVSDLAAVNILTLLSRTRFLCEFSYELFRVGGWREMRPRRFRIEMPDDFIFQGSTPQFSLVLDWFFVNYLEMPWKGRFAPKKVAVDPFILAYGAGEESTEWTIDIRYICLRLRDPPRRYRSVEVEEGDSFKTFERSAIDIAVLVEHFTMCFQWGSGGAFSSRYYVGEASVWQLEPLAQNRVTFFRHPKEVVDESFRFLWLHHETVGAAAPPTKEEEKRRSTSPNSRMNAYTALQARYNVSVEKEVKKVSSWISVGSLDITPEPYFLFNLKDSLFSLHIRNAYGRILRWEPRVANVLPRSPSLEDQDYSTNYYFTLFKLNLTVPHLLRPCQRVRSLFFVSIKSIEFVLSSEVHGVNYMWSISVDSIVNNGVVVENDASEGGFKLRPVFVPPFWSEEGSETGKVKNLFYLARTAKNYVTGAMNSVWIVLPLKREIYALCEVFEKGGYQQLRWLWTFLEERRMWRKGMSSKGRDSSPFSVYFTLKAPYMVVAEHGCVVAGNPNLGRGVVISPGDIVVEKDTNGSGAFGVSLSAVGVTSLQEHLNYVMKPMEVDIVGISQKDVMWNVKIIIHAVVVEVEQSLYELMLQSLVRHFVVTEAELLDVFHAETEDPAFCLQLPMGDPTECESGDLSLPAAGGEFGLRVCVEWDSFTLCLLRNNFGIFLKMGEMSAMYERPVVVEGQRGIPGVARRMHVKLAFITLGADDRPNLLEMRPVTPSISSRTRDQSKERKGEVEGVEQSAENLSVYRCLSFCLDARGKEEEIQVNFGKAVGFFEKSTMHLLLSSLYEPYRRIVLPEYHVHEVRYIDSDVTLQKRLVLSQRTKMRVVQGRHNHITIDGNGHDIHFIDARSPLLSLGDGLTLCIINARIHLYGKVLEYYMAVGNGSYVIVDATCNTIINVAPSPCGDCSAATAGLEPIVSDIENGEEKKTSSTIRRGTKQSGHQNSKNNNSASFKSGFGTNNVSRRVMANVVLFLTLPEGTRELHVPLQQKTNTAHFSRSLVLQATMSARVEMLRFDGHLINESSTFDMSEFSIYCKYLDANGGLVENRSLVSELALTVHHTRSYAQLENVLKRYIEVLCPYGIELRLCYGDVYLCWDAILGTQQTLGHIEKNVLDDVVGSEITSSLETPWYTSQQGNTTTDLETYTSLSFNLRYLSVDLVDDSSDVSIPLFCVRVESLTTPMVEKRGLAFKLHVSFTWSITYYNFSICSWCSLLEPVLLDVVLRSEPNVSLEDVRRRKGLLRAGLHLRPVRLHLSARVMENLRRIWLLKKHLWDAQHSFEQDVVWKPLGTSKQQFCMYRVVQHVGHEVEVRFAHDSPNHSPTPSILNANETIQFNFPRVEGHELPPWQHRLLVSFRNNTEVVNVAKTGKRLVFHSPGPMGSHLLVDVTVSEGQKLVEFRTNIAFKNELPFTMHVSGVGLISPDGVLHLPLGSLRHRTSFMPHMEKHRSTPCSLGVCYDMLPFLYGQVFLGVCTVECNETAEDFNSMQASASLRRAVFFFLCFDKKCCVGDSDVIDCRGTFQAPLFIVNGTSLPMRICLMYRKKSEKQHRSPLHFSKSNSYEHVTTIDVASGERSCITQMNPLKDIYIDIVANQANGEPMGPAPIHPDSNPSPALVHSVSKKECDRIITLHDQRGASIILHVDCTPRVVTIWCPYWIINRTPHCLQIADVKNGTLAAGLCSEEGIAPGSFDAVGSGISRGGPAYLFNTKRMEKLGDKAAIYVSIGRYAFSSGIHWTKWSDPVPIGALLECGIVNCSFYKNVNLSLSYTVEFVGGRMKATRVVTFNPRWILQNCTDTIITCRQSRIKFDENMSSHLRPIELSPDHSQIIDFSRESDAANAIQVRLPAAAGLEIQRCYWSQPLNIGNLCERAFNIHYEIRMKVQDRRCEYPEDTVVQLGDVLYVTRAGSDVLMLSCHRRGSTMFVVVSRPYRPPLVVENRTSYTINLRQQDVPQLVVVYPRTTRGFAWENSKYRPVMELWVAEGKNARSKPLFINFDPQAALKRSEQQQQALLLPGGVTLFVRIRGLSRTSYAISITTENTIDTFCSLPYFQFFFRVKVDSIHALFSDENEDFILLTVKPVKLFFSQGKEAEGQGDEQIFSASVSVIQIDDERRCAKQRVVAQLVEDKSFTFRFSRKLFRWTPIVYFKEFVINLSSIEIHLEDSFIFQAMKYLEQMRVVLGNKSVNLPPTHMNGHLLASGIVGEGKRVRATDVWKQQIVFMDHLLIEQTMVSISLYRSPGAQNDPMWEQLGYLSLFIRSVQDARFVWRRIEQWGVYDTMWLLGASYSAFYKHQLQQQMSNVIHVAGLDVMRGFVTDLLQGYFTSAIVTNIDLTKMRLGRRAEAHFADDEKSLTIMGGVASNSRNTHEDMLEAGDDGGGNFGRGITEPHAESQTSIRFHTKHAPENESKIIEAALRLPWSAFFARVKDTELCQYGIFAVRRFVRTLDLANPSRMQWQMQDLVFYGNEASGAVQKKIEPCERCEYIEMMREQRVQSDSLSVLPHPDFGLITWAEFVHHISWGEFVQMCSPSEIRRYAGLVMRSIVGNPNNVIRIDSDKELTSDKEIA